MMQGETDEGWKEDEEEEEEKTEQRGMVSLNE